MPTRGPGPKLYRAVLFDVGGTLVEDQDFVLYGELALSLGVDASPEAIAEAVRELRQGSSDGTRASEPARFWQEALERASAATVPRPTAESFLELLVRKPRTARLFSDARGTLRKLASEGRRLGVVSNSSSEAGVRALLETLGIAQAFSTIVAAGTEGVAKPDPEIFRRAVRRLGIDVGEAFYVGDLAELDARAAALAGLGSVWLHRDGTGFGTDPPEITSLSELPHWIARLEGASVK